jgi:hypothetical protein
MENFEIVERKTIEQLVNELDFLNSQVLAKIKNPKDGSGLIIELLDINKKIANLSDITYLLDNLSSRTEIILGNFIDFEKTNEKMIQEQTQKVEIFKNALELRYNNLSYQFLQEFKVATESLLTDVSTKVEEIKKEIDKKLKAIDLKKFEKANQNVEDIIINFNVLHKKIEEIYFKNNIFTKILSFVGGATVMALVFFFLK